MEYYVYILSDNNKAFYVGMTHDMINRYKQHCTYSSCSACSYYTYWMWHTLGEFPKLTLIGLYNNPVMAGNCESALIRYFVSINNKLCNTECNPPHNRIINCIPLHVTAKRRPSNYAVEIFNAAIINLKDTLKTYL